MNSFRQICKKLGVSLGITSLLAATQASAALSSQEQQIKQYLSTQTEQQLTLLEKLVNINSGTENIEGVLKVKDILDSEFKELGFKTTYVVPKEMEGHHAGTFIAEHKGPGKKILLIGHLDTVFAKDHPFQKFERKGDKATGPGVIDDKGGDVVLLYALKALKAANELDNANITVVLTGDEEESFKPTKISRKPLLDAAEKAEIALDFEDAISLETATVARRGITNWTLTSTGKEGHSSRVGGEKFGWGAIYEKSRILDTLRRKLSSQQYLTINPGEEGGGREVEEQKDSTNWVVSGKQNIIAKLAKAKGEFRYIDNNQKLKTKKSIEAIVSDSLAGTQSSIDFVDGIPPMALTTENKKLLALYSAVSNDFGYGKVTAFDPAARGAADIAYIASTVNANLSGLGPVGVGSHTSDETLDIPSLEAQEARAAGLILRLKR